MAASSSTTNLYGYVTNPTGMVDPLGLAGAAIATSAAEKAAAIGGRVAIPAWVTNPLGAFVLGMWPTPMGDATTEGAGYTGTVFAPTDRTGRYDRPIVDQRGWNTELPSLQPGGCRSEQPIDGLSSCPSELPIFDQSGWASELPIASPLPGDNTIGGGYQPAGMDMIVGAVFNEGDDLNARATRDVDSITAPIDFDGHILNGEVKRNGDVVRGHSIASGNVRVIPGT